MNKFWTALFLSSVVLTSIPAIPTAAVAATKENAQAVKKAMVTEGPVLSAELVAGPFDLHRKYRSMEGPYVMQKLRIGDLLASRRVVMPESMVTFLEGNQHAAALSMQGVLSTNVERYTSLHDPIGLVDSRKKPRELLWLKGMELDVLDEHDKPLPTAEFICHMNLDVDPLFRELVFPLSEGVNSGRIMTLTQGQTAFFFPRGFAVPVASDEIWTFTLQAANRTTDEHRRVKHRIKLYFLEDSELEKPIKALYWFNPYLAVALDKTYDNKPAHANGHIDCFGITQGKAAPNTLAAANFKDSKGRWVSGHWEVPPGTTMWKSPLLEGDRESLVEDRKVHAVWSHVHPLCETSSLVVCDGNSRKKIFTARVKTNTKNGLELDSIEDILSSKGIVLPGKKNYELEAKYVNNTGENQDSMVSLGVFCADNKFMRPVWPTSAVVGSLPDPKGASGATQTNTQDAKEDVYCGMRPGITSGTAANEAGKFATTSGATPATTTGAAATPGCEKPSGNLLTAFLHYPLFDPQKDGPLLKTARQVELKTSAGVINLVLDPSRARNHATQMHKLLTRGAMNGTALYRYEPNFVLQFNTADRKAIGQEAISVECQDLLRRLPVEIPVQPLGAHKKFALSMARYDERDSAVSSFSILLTDSPHLDGEYTVFGEVLPDETSRQTIARIVSNWPAEQPWIISATDKGEYAGTSQLTSLKEPACGGTSAASPVRASTH